MYDGAKIIAGLLVFAMLITFPLWYHLGRATPPPQPDLNTPAIAQLPRKQCVESVSYMRSSHMELLKDWRNWVVREGKRIYVARDGTEYVMSLEGTCLKCHANKARFCDSCHNYVRAEPSCWNCHLAPEEGGP